MRQVTLPAWRRVSWPAFLDRTWPIPPSKPPDFRSRTSMAGATVYVNQAPVPLLYVSQTQINFQVPSGLAAGTANMYVTRSGGQSALFQFTVVSSAPGIFQDTSNHAIAQNPDDSTNSSGNPVASGAVLVVYLTGQGALDHAVPDGTATPDSPLSSATATATATIGGMNATVQFLGLTPGFTGPGAGQYRGAARSPPRIIRW